MASAIENIKWFFGKIWSAIKWCAKPVSKIISLCRSETSTVVTVALPRPPTPPRPRPLDIPPPSLNIEIEIASKTKSADPSSADHSNARYTASSTLTTGSHSSTHSANRYNTASHSDARSSGSNDISISPDRTPPSPITTLTIPGSNQEALVRRAEISPRILEKRGGSFLNPNRAVQVKRRTPLPTPLMHFANHPNTVFAPQPAQSLFAFGGTVITDSPLRTITSSASSRVTKLTPTLNATVLDLSQDVLTLGGTVIPNAAAASSVSAPSPLLAEKNVLASSPRVIVDVAPPLKTSSPPPVLEDKNTITEEGFPDLDKIISEAKRKATEMEMENLKRLLNNNPPSNKENAQPITSSPRQFSPRPVSPRLDPLYLSPKTQAEVLSRIGLTPRRRPEQRFSRFGLEERPIDIRGFCLDRMEIMGKDISMKRQNRLSVQIAESERDPLTKKNPLAKTPTVVEGIRSNSNSSDDEAVAPAPPTLSAPRPPSR